ASRWPWSPTARRWASTSPPPPTAPRCGASIRTANGAWCSTRPRRPTAADRSAGRKARPRGVEATWVLRGQGSCRERRCGDRRRGPGPGFGRSRRLAGDRVAETVLEVGVEGVPLLPEEV